ncbi:MAG: YicC family protein [Bacteroidales bacterium]|nr:YicC family protein [Bacteroidales bacterium]
MIKSMTGYGRGEAILSGGKMTIEIRSLNGKNADINLKTSLFPKDKELEVRKTLSERLRRGTIDLYVTWEPNADEAVHPLNAEAVKAYYTQILALRKELPGFIAPDDVENNALLAAVLRLPDVVDTGARKSEAIGEGEWPLVKKALNEAVTMLDTFRSTEGAVLYKDVTGRVQIILDLYDEVERSAAERLDAVKVRILKAAEDLKVKMDPERFEQEMIFYLEKLDINEETVRLRQHCRYFMDTIDGEPEPGKKLGFIIQEMGREINTTGSKANHASIQKCVVRMKDELEKIREQSLNIL